MSVLLLNQTHAQFSAAECKRNGIIVIFQTKNVNAGWGRGEKQLPGYSTHEKGNYRSFKSHQVTEAIVKHWPDKPTMFNPVVKYLKPLFKEKVISKNIYFIVNANKNLALSLVTH